MKVLILHNRYREPGGEDAAASAEAALLREGGVDVVEATFDNQGSPLQLGLHAAWSRDSYRQVHAWCAAHQPDLCHVHNFWMRLSPSVHPACHAAGVATVQTLHNFRLMCVNGLLLRHGVVCEDCAGGVPWLGVVRRCYRDSFAASATVAGMIAGHRVRGTWDRDVDAFVALSRHSRDKLAAGRMPADRIFVKPNFVSDPGEPELPPSASASIVYAGRLSPEKGLDRLLTAWRSVDGGRLVIIGDGPDRPRLEAQPNVRVIFIGARRPEEVVRAIASARAVVLPSLGYENFPRLLVEAMACGRPALVSDIGALAEIVEHGRTGLRFHPGDTQGIAETLNVILADGALADRLGVNARAEYLAKYTPERNFEQLMRIYHFALTRR